MTRLLVAADRGAATARSHAPVKNRLTSYLTLRHYSPVATNRRKRSLAQAHDAIAALQRLAELFVARRVALARRVGLTEQQWRVLEEISTEHFMPSMFAKSRDSSPAAVSKILRQLLDKGLVVTSVSQADGRQRNYELSEGGTRTMSELRRHRQVAIDEVWMHFGDDALQRFATTANQISDAIEEFANQSSDSGET